MRSLVMRTGVGFAILGYGLALFSVRLEASPAGPTVVTTASPNATLPASPPGIVTLSDSAILAGGFNPTGSLVFTLTGPGGFAYTQTDTVSGNGTYTASTTLPTAGTVAGTYTWTVQYSGDANNNAANDQGGVAEQTLVSSASPTLTGIPSPATVTLGSSAVTLKDSATLSGGYHPGGTVTFTLVAPGGGTVDTETVTVSGNGTYTTPTGFALLSGALTGTYQWNVVYNGDPNNSAASNINAANQRVAVSPQTHFTVSAPATATAGTAFNFTLTALDQLNNVVTGYTGTVHFTSTDGAAALPANSPLTNGVGTFSATLKTTGSQTLTATDTVTSSITGVSNTIAVSAAAATHFTVTAPATATAGTAFNFTVTALDQFNNTATGYTGTVHFTSTDGAATLPANSTLTNGIGTFSATLRTVGSSTIAATDTTTASITGTSGVVAVNTVTGTIHLLGPSVCPAGSNWSNPACWDLNRAPVSGDDVVIAGSAAASTNYDLGAGISLHSLTISGATGALNVTGGPIGLQAGATVTDSFSNNGTDTLPGITLAGAATFAVTPASETLRIAAAITGSSGITKAGPGTLLLAGANTYSGATTVSGGTVNVSGSLANSAVTVGAGGTLTGTGTVASISAQSGGTVTGDLTSTGGSTFAAGSVLSVILTSNTNFTQLFGGLVDLTAGPTLNVAIASGFTPSTATSFTIIPGSVTGQFNGLASGAVLSAGGVSFRIVYGSVILTPITSPTIPAVSGWVLMPLAALLAAAGALAAGRRKAPPVSL